MQDTDESFEPSAALESTGGAANGSTAGGSEYGLPHETEMRVRAVVAVARYHGIDLDRNELRLKPGAEPPVPAALIEWVRSGGLWARAERLTWRNLMKLNGPAPVVLLFKDGGAGVLTGVNVERRVVFIRDPRLSQNEPAVPVDELRLSQVWNGEALMVRRQRGVADEDKPFDSAWIASMIIREKAILRDIAFASVALSVLTILPPLMIMTVIDRVIVHQSVSTLEMMALILVIACVYETLLGWSRRELIQVLSARTRRHPQPACLQQAAWAAARLFRTQPGRPDHLPPVRRPTGCATSSPASCCPRSSTCSP